MQLHCPIFGICMSHTMHSCHQVMTMSLTECIRTFVTFLNISCFISQLSASFTPKLKLKLSTCRHHFLSACFAQLLYLYVAGWLLHGWSVATSKHLNNIHVQICWKPTDWETCIRIADSTANKTGSDNKTTCNNNNTLKHIKNTLKKSFCWPKYFRFGAGICHVDTTVYRAAV